MKKFILYYNPVSGNAAFRKKIDGFIEMFQALGTVLIPYRTTPLRRLSGLPRVYMPMVYWRLVVMVLSIR